MKKPVYAKNMPEYRTDPTSKSLGWLFLLILLPGTILPEVKAETSGVTETSIRIGSTLPLTGDISTAGQSLKLGIEAALKGAKVQGRTIDITFEDDMYVPTKTVEAANKLIKQGIFAMLGSLGTPNAVAALPILAEHKIPAVGFYWGPQPAPGDILNFRPGFADEVAASIEAAIQAGIKPQSICLYIQNDAYGISGIKGAIAAFGKYPDMAPVVDSLNKILAIPEKQERNNNGPVGFYSRDTFRPLEGYKSLKKWEENSKTKCRFVATVGTPFAVSNIINYANILKEEDWVYSTTTTSGGQGLIDALKKAQVKAKIVAPLVVPALDTSFPITVDARKELGSAFSPISMEGFVVGKMFLAIMNNIKGDLNHENFLKSARSQIFDIGGLKINFTTGNQGSTTVFLSYLDDHTYKPITAQQLGKELNK